MRYPLRVPNANYSYICNLTNTTSIQNLSNFYVKRLHAYRQRWRWKMRWICPTRSLQCTRCSHKYLHSLPRQSRRVLPTWAQWHFRAACRTLVECQTQLSRTFAGRTSLKPYRSTASRSSSGMWVCSWAPGSRRRRSRAARSQRAPATSTAAPPPLGHCDSRSCSTDVALEERL